MTVTWSAFRERLRRSLKATGNSAKWGDDDLRDYVNAALDRFAAHTAPARTTAYVDPNAALASVDLPDDLVTLGPVWLPDRELLPPIALDPGMLFPSETVTTTAYPVGYYVWPEGRLNLTRALPAGKTLTVFYWAYWPEVTLDADRIEVPRWALEALEWYVAYKAMLKHGVGQALLGQWDTKQDAGRPEDNPPEQFARFCLAQYERVLVDHSPQNRNGWERPIT